MVKKRVIVGMSGGVDSSVAAWLLKEEGYEVIGLFMKNWNDNDSEVCNAEEDYKDMIKVCDQIGIPYYSVNFEKEYQEQVFSNFLSEFKKGRTPNPDILCNKEIKFGHFYKNAKNLGADFIATGHYARNIDGALKKGLDNGKDQTYFLYAINKDCLKDTLFPVGNIEKKEVRKIAEEIGLKTANKKDSTGICFIGPKNFKSFIKNYIPAQIGEIRNLKEQVVGHHDGVLYYTLGQRQGLGIGGSKDSNGDAWFVVRKDVQKNVLYVGQGHDINELMSSSITATNLNFLVDDISEKFICKVKCRYRQPDQEAEVIIKNNEAVINFHNSQRAVTPGQSIVFYDDDTCLGGGIIDKIIK